MLYSRRRPVAVDFEAAGAVVQCEEDTIMHFLFFVRDVAAEDAVVCYIVLYAEAAPALYNMQ